MGPHVTLWQPADGGHVGFPDGRMPGHVRRMPEEVGSWLLEAAGLQTVVVMPDLDQGRLRIHLGAPTWIRVSPGDSAMPR